MGDLESLEQNVQQFTRGKEEEGGQGVCMCVCVYGRGGCYTASVCGSVVPA